jgi:hypothetical protein
MVPTRQRNMSYSSATMGELSLLYGNQIISKGLRLPHPPVFHRPIFSDIWEQLQQIKT